MKEGEIILEAILREAKRLKISKEEFFAESGLTIEDFYSNPLDKEKIFLKMTQYFQGSGIDSSIRFFEEIDKYFIDIRNTFWY